MKFERDATEISQLVNEHLKYCNLHRENPPWIIQQSPLGGLGTFAARDIRPGEIVYEDYPIMLGPRAVLLADFFCVCCYTPGEVRACSRGCGLPVCSDICENSSDHLKECEAINKWSGEKRFRRIEKKMLECLTPVRAVFLDDFQKRLVKSLHFNKSEAHGFEIETLKKDLQLEIPEDDQHFMRSMCYVLDANAFEVLVVNKDIHTTIRGLYPLASLANHRCVPNTFHVFNEEHCMATKAAVFIPKGTEIFHSYTSLLWGTLSRRFHLIRTKHFFCCCPRCLDPTEFGTYMNAVLCKKCSGYVLPCDLTVRNSDWACVSCKEVVTNERIGMIISVLGASLASHEKCDVNDILAFLKDQLLKLVPGSSSTAIELKYNLIWILGYKDGYSWKELSDDLLQIKTEMCLEILNILLMLGTGLCKMKGLLLYELFCCRREKQRRADMANAFLDSSKVKDMESLLIEASEILSYDVGAPEEIKLMNRKKRQLRII